MLHRRSSADQRGSGSGDAVNEKTVQLNESYVSTTAETTRTTKAIASSTTPMLPKPVSMKSVIVDQVRDCNVS